MKYIQYNRFLRYRKHYLLTPSPFWVIYFCYLMHKDFMVVPAKYIAHEGYADVANAFTLIALYSYKFYGDLALHLICLTLNIL